MKNILSLVLAFLLALMLCACADNAQNDLPSVPEEASGDLSVEQEQVPAEQPVKQIEPIEETDGGDALEEVVMAPEYAEPSEDEEVPTDEGVTHVAFNESVSNEDFTLTFSAPTSTYYLNDEICAEATLSLTGHESITVYSGDPILTYSLTGSTCFEDGQGAGMVATVLMEYSFNNIEDAIYPITKSGGWSESDPNADFYEGFFASDKYQLPAGVYTLTAILDYSTDPDDVLGTRKVLKTTYTFEVIGETVNRGEVPTGDYEDLTPSDVTVTLLFMIDSAPPMENVPVNLPNNVAEELRGYLAKLSWESKPSDCLCDLSFEIDGYTLAYSSSCGSFTNGEYGFYAHLSDKDRASLNTLLSKYVPMFAEYFEYIEE